MHPAIAGLIAGAAFLLVMAIVTYGFKKRITVDHCVDHGHGVDFYTITPDRNTGVIVCSDGTKYKIVQTEIR